MRWLTRLTAAVVLALGTAAAPAPAGAQATAEPGSELTVMLMTVGPSGLVWERFGHNAIWIRDASRGLDVAFNWGTFDFNQPNFIGRFLTGETRYWLVANQAQDDIARYVDADRSVWVQELELTPAQRRALLDFVTWNLREENRFYRYDYYLDNCSTRVRDAIDSVLGGALRGTFSARRTGTSYRSHTRRLTAGDPLVYTGIQLALGRPADGELSAWEESFLPVRLMEHVRSVRVRRADGTLVPLVKRESRLYKSREWPEPGQPPSFLVQFLGLGAAIGGAAALFGRARTRGSDAALGIVGGLWTLACGCLGTALLLAGTVTRHVFMGRNFNLAAVSPLALILLALLVAAVGTRREEARRRWATRASLVAALIVALTIVGWLGALVFGQRSGEVFALALPANVGLWWALRSRAAR